jgi:hypothetical protein
MKRQIQMIIVLGTAALCFACDPPNEGAVQITDTPPDSSADMSLAYVSGHLGSTWDCSEPGVRVGVTGAAKPAPSAAQAADFAAELGDCPGGCGPMNCESGAATVQVQNIGDVVLSGLEVTDIQLIRTDGTLLADLPAEDVTVVEGVETITTDASITLRIEFKAPHSADINQEDLLKIRIIVVSEEGADAELVTPEVQILPAIAT